MTDLAVVPLLERLNDFFCQGANTDLVGIFFSEEEACIARLMETAIHEDGGVETDSPHALELFALYRRYGSLIEGVISQFVAHEETSNQTAPSLTDIAEAVMEEIDGPHGSTRYLCTAYIAGALDLGSFLELAEEMNEMADYSVEPRDGDN